MVIVLQCENCRVRTEIKVVEGLEELCINKNPYEEVHNIVQHCPICGTTDCAELMMYAYDETLEPAYRLIKSHRQS
jgi:hypothetical protein